jgi:hypothetical protein
VLPELIRATNATIVDFEMMPVKCDQPVQDGEESVLVDIGGVVVTETSVENFPAGLVEGKDFEFTSTGFFIGVANSIQPLSLYTATVH